MEQFSEYIVKYRWIIIIGCLLVSAWFAMQIPSAEVEPDVKKQISPDMPSRVATDRIEEMFGGTDMLLIMVKADDVLAADTLERVKEISRGLERVSGVDDVLSLFELKYIRGEDGAMYVDPAVRRIPKTENRREKLRSEIMDNDIVYGSVVSKDFTATAVIAVLKNGVSDAEIVAAIRDLVAGIPGDEEVVISGLPYVRVNVQDYIRGDLRRFLPFGILIMIVFLFVTLRQLRGVILPFVVVIMAICVAMGLIPLLGWKIQMITVLLPVMLIAIANDYGIHLIARYQEDNYPGNSLSKADLAKKVFLGLGKPVVMTGLTSAAGMLCLIGHVIIPARQMGVLAALGILFALAASLLFIPAVLSLLPKAKPVVHDNPDAKKLPWLERALRFFGRTVAHSPRQVLGVSVLVTVISAFGIFSVVVDTNPENYFTPDHPVVYASEMANTHFGGVTNLGIVFEGDIKEPSVMREIDSLEHRIRALPEVGNTTSIARVIRQMSRALNDPDEPGYDAIPDTRNAIAQYFELYAMSGEPDDFERIVDFTYEHAQLNARLNVISTERINSVVRQVREMAGSMDHVTTIGGFSLILGELAELIVRGQFISLGMAILIVGILVVAMFRSLSAGLIAILPLSLSIVMLFGLMGYFGIELNIATAMLSSIMIGVGVDYTIHYLWRYREERFAGLSPEDAARKTLTTTGRGIVFNALSVIIGFIVLMFSNFLPVRFFGFLVVVSITACLIGALLVVPALCIVTRPAFLEPGSAA